MEYRPDIDGLRALAIVLVVAFHARIPGFSGGFVGVDVFFVLSGYLITGLLWAELREKGQISWIGFYSRRARRLLPALSVVAVMTLVASLFVMVPDPELRWMAQSVIAVAAFSSNIFFWIKTSGYFGAGADELPLLNTWSLSVEAQFYVVWPPLLSATWWLTQRASRHKVFVGGFVLGSVALASFVSAIMLTANDQAAAFFWMPPRLWELSAGAVIALLARRLPSLKSTALPLSILALVAILSCAHLFDGTTPFPGLGALPVVSATAVLIVVGAGSSRNPVARMLGAGPLVYVGRLSYSWYLIHWPILVLVRTATQAASVARDSLLATSSLFLAAVLYRWVEQPVRTGQVLAVWGPKHTLLTAVAALVLVSGSGALVLRNTYAASQVDVTTSEAAAMRENRSARTTCPNLPHDQPGGLDCAFDPGRPVRLVLTGDSHALALMPAARKLADALGWGLDVLWDPGCPFIVGYDPGSGAPAIPPSCVDEDKADLAFIVKNASHIGAVVTTSRSTSWVVIADDLEATDQASARWATALRGTLRSIADAGVPAFVVHDVPRFARSVPQCLVHTRGQCDVSREEAEMYRGPVYEAEIKAVEGIAGVRTWDPFPCLCSSTVCFAEHGGHVLYTDETHLSLEGSNLVADHLLPAFEKWIVSAGVDGRSD